MLENYKDSHIQSPDFNGFLSRWMPLGLALVSSESRRPGEDWAIFAPLLETRYSITESREPVDIIYRDIIYRDQDSMPTLSQHWYLEQQPLKICVCCKAGKAYVTADDFDRQTSLPQEEREVM